MRSRKLCLYQATYKLCGHWNKNHSTVLTIEQVGMHWTALSFADFWSETQLSEVLQIVYPALQTSAGVTETKTFMSELFQFILPKLLLCKINHKKENRFPTIMPFFPRFRFVLPSAIIWCSWWKETVSKHAENRGDNLPLAIKICQVPKPKLCAVSLIS